MGWVVAPQVLAWVLGGLLFAWMPFKAWVKAADTVQRPALNVDAALLVQQMALPHEATRQELAQLGTVSAAAWVMAAEGPALKLNTAEGERWLTMQGQWLEPPTQAAVLRRAQQVYRGSGQVLEIEQLAQVPRSLLWVQELRHRGAVWRVQFDDKLHTRLYFDARSGEFLVARTRAWVLYDLMWRLHVMDYSEGEDFNNPLLRAAALLALGLTLTGVVLGVNALLRSLRRRRRD
ncbi:hypothetical protein ACG0Z6_05250 [Roseateles sp. BYS180W]|uniref:PepSY domain-containing protein n=1 Tax=Roseateles rivi TaxID=3299028 RepID=A0ABW7FTK0_9BURK